MFNMQGDIAGRNFEQIMNKIKANHQSVTVKETDGCALK
jgi:hypothetical protein